MSVLIIVTRPGFSGSQLQQLLQTSGLSTVHLPGFTITAQIPPVTAKDIVLNADWWIFTSPAAIKYTLEWFDSIAINPDDYPHIAVLSEQSATRLQISSKDHTNTIIWPASGHRSEDLLMHPLLQDLSNRQIVIFNAPGGRQLLTDRLRRRGAGVQELNVYQRTPVVLSEDCLQQLSDWSGPTLTLWTSNTAIDHLQQQLTRKLWQKLMNGDQLLLSNRQKSVLEKQCAGNMYIADAPDNTSLHQQIIRRCI